MNQVTTQIDRFSFSARELSPQLLKHIQQGRTGYLQHQFDRLASSAQTYHWNLAVNDGRVLYSGNRAWSSQSLLRLVSRYVGQTRTEPFKTKFDRLRERVIEDKLTPLQLFTMMKESKIIDDDRLRAALQTKILNDLDIYLLMGGGSAQFTQEDKITVDLPVVGFEASQLLEQAKQRHLLWFKLKPEVPSMNLCPILDRTALKSANLPDGQQRRIEMLVKSERTLTEIADDMAKDPLEVAVMFSRLAKMGALSFQTPKKTTLSTVMVIDDSPLLLAQFQHWISALGYRSVVCQHAANALNSITKVKPSVIFIDINMPVISGFELVKMIRQEPELADIPLVILTGEQRLSNKWRAQWSGCEFLNKPLTSMAIGDFQVQLEELLPRLISGSGAAVDENSNN
jgi:CheY-like chemotaxis protein